MSRALWSSLFCAVSLLACSRSSSGPRPPNPDEIPEAIDVAGGTLTTGFAIGQLHRSMNVVGFRITRSPITVARYRQCVAVGACSPPASTSAACSDPARSFIERSTYSDDPANDAVPVTCTTSQQAMAYCAWQGGSLPSLEQWQIAARGTNVQRFSWGDEPATCEQHALGTPDPASSHACCDGSCTDAQAFSVGTHRAAASGLADAMMTRAELLAKSPASTVGACTDAAAAGCIVYGLVPGAIDGASDDTTTMTFGFRCAWSDK